MSFFVFCYIKLEQADRYFIQTFLLGLYILKYRRNIAMPILGSFPLRAASIMTMTATAMRREDLYPNPKHTHGICACMKVLAE